MTRPALPREVVNVPSAGEHPVARRGPVRWPAAVSGAILILTGCFHLYRGVPIEAVVFCGAGVAVVMNGMGWLPNPRSWSPPLPGPVRSVLLVGVGVLVIGMLPVKGIVETVVLAAIGATVMAVGWCQPDTSTPVTPDGLRRTAYSWAVAGLCLCLTELFVYLLADPPLREDEYPTLTYLLQPFVDQTVWRAVLLALWLAAGLALLRWSSAGGRMKSTVVE